MTSATLKVKNGVLRLPKKLRRAWMGAEVYVSGDWDTITLKRLSRPAMSLGEMVDAFRKGAKRAKLSRTDVETEIENARSGTR